MNTMTDSFPDAPPKLADQQRQQLRTLLLDGAQVPVTGAADARYFAGLRQRIAAKAASQMG